MDKVHFETSGPLGILTLANPPLNLLSGELIEDLRAAVTAVKRAPLRGLLVRAEGMCVGGGLELVLACDLIWAAASARFGQLEATIGTTTLLSGVQRLAERAGPSRAREIIYTAEQYDAATFERWNIVNRVVPDDTFESQTRAFAERLANGPTLAYAAGKRIVRAYLEGGVRAADRVVDEVGPPLFQSEDMRAAVAALVEHGARNFRDKVIFQGRSEEHTSELQSPCNLVCRLLLEKKKL